MAKGVALKGAVVAITGGGRGIGLAIAKAMAEQGARVSLGDIDADLALKAAEPLGGYGGRLDVRDRESFVKFLDTTRRMLGPIDVLINNAGIMPIGAFTDETDAMSDTQIDINLRGVIHGCKAVLPEMLARGTGHIVNVASLAGVMPVPGLAVYCATKFAVLGLTQTLREEYRDSGIHFTTIMPSKVRTELASGSDAARGIPSVSPGHVARSVVDAIKHQRREVAVPSYLGSTPAVLNLTPQWLMRRLRHAIDDRAGLEKIDHQQRASYTQRIESLTAAKKLR
ncbi:SDR family oxidoreductase [Stenotrophobium rhamnosiphilum]|uniref:3-hydroxybutyrate dehydrogenase n=1 Tax=Stenotrophobium rhamnosiphilum TaxID=2029166 RepID=A0A2T5MKM2_9GAMM|nr:SDR family oxidoreductase [Stenotrophobium rhamnosiphilum]PTU33127.1 3-hydroxybutyrate dehydrogenase [Stenotrophobium rhamnosiphilum]